jgi:HEXXH motif-containing protein
MDLDQELRRFACPDPGPGTELLDLIADAHAREVVRRFLAGHEENLRRGGLALGRFLHAWREEETDFSSVWDLSFGALADAISEGFRGDPLECAASVALALHLAGVPGTWHADLASPTRLRLGSWLLPAARSVRVEAGGGSLAVHLQGNGNGPALLLDRSGGRWQADRAAELPYFELAGSEVPFLIRATLAGWAQEGLPAPPLEAVPEDRVDLCRGAVELLRDCAPEYLAWTARVLRAVIPLEAPAGLMLSGSGPHHCGTLQLSLAVEPVQLAEMLVHESSHQYYYFLTRLGDVDDGSDPTLYYSPFKKMERPIRLILLAYHAFANVLIFYRRCRARGLDDGGYCQRNEEKMAPRLRTLETALRATPALTPIGRALWEPLAQRLREAG